MLLVFASVTRNSCTCKTSNSVVVGVSSQCYQVFLFIQLKSVQLDLSESTVPFHFNMSHSEKCGLVLAKSIVICMQ